MSVSDWRIQVRNAELETVGLVDVYRSLDVVLRFNGVSTWVLQTGAPIPFLGFGAGMAGLIIKHGDAVQLSGPVTGIDKDISAKREIYVYAGVSDDHWLQDRLALPVPLGPPYTSASHDVRTGAAETIMRQYVDANLGPSAKTDRRVPGLTLAASGGLGSTVTERARFQTVLELLQSIALVGGGLGFRIFQSGAGLQFQVYQPTDKTAAVKLSFPLGTLLSAQSSEKASGGNYIYAAGGDELTDRVIEEGQDPVSIATYGRVERFKDQRQTIAVGELQQAITEELENLAEQLDFKPTPQQTAGLQFPVHYGLGDKIQVVLDGLAVNDVLREVRVTLDIKGERIVPVVGGPGSSITPGDTKAIVRMNRRVSNLERR